MPRTDRPRARRIKKTPKLSRLQKPADMSLEEWQIELRRQFGRAQKFRLKNLGDHPALSEFQVTNPASRNSYRVTVRGTGPADNSCTCPDYATNTLGTCKHIEFTLAKLMRKPEAVRALKNHHWPPTSEIHLQYGAQRQIRFRPGDNCPAELAKLAKRYFGEDGLLVPEAAPQFDEFLAAARAIEPDLRVGDDVFAYLAELRDAEARKLKVIEAFPRGIKSAAFKDLLQVPLYDYQREGALFAARTGRCLIGDEMGLGKTVQAIAAAEIMARLFGVERVLIVCPTSLKHQWQREIKKFTGRTAEVIGGLRPSRVIGFASLEPFFKITNYDTVHADLDLIDGWAPDLVILDEAQRIKNWSTRVARSVKKIQSPYAIVLTGTPLENRLEELVSIVQFVDRYRLGPTFRLLHDHQKLDDVGKVVGYKELDKIGQTLSPVLLRRQKDQVLDQLPERIDNTLFVPMTEYQRVLHTENQEVVARIVQKWRRYKFLTEADKQRLMIALQRMRMSCDNSYLLDDKTTDGLKPTEVMTVLGELLERPGTKAVIFSQWLRMHELLVGEAKKKGWGHVLFHGGVPSKKRGELIEQFRNDDDCRLFFSTDAGGVGLNLQFAAVVVNVDLPWNPAVLEQRIGRVHRLGQKQPVRVVNFVAKGTIEEGMLALLKFKKSLFAGVLDGGESEVSMGGSRLTKFMETVEAASAQIPAAAQTEAEEAKEARRELAPAKVDKGERKSDETSALARPAADPWSGLLQAGMALAQQFSESSKTGPTADGLVRRDERTGETYLRLPVPSPEMVQQALQMVSGLLQSLQKPR
ncbi:MAG TPA: DEAD/DEAH box helicase [Gemmataceae bacterium]|nr:DEAD/DEAH box helicase [Gemmataceae bacterium]